MIAWLRGYLARRERRGVSVAAEQRRRAQAVAAQDRLFAASWDAEAVREARR